MANLMTYGNKGGYNDAQTVLAASAYLTDQTVQINNLCQIGVQVVMRVSVKTESPTSLTLTIKGICPISGKKYTILAGAAVSTVSTNVYTVFPGMTAASNVSANDFIPKTFEISVAGVGLDVANNFT